MSTKPSETPCVHYWKIEAPAGPTSLGICKYCRDVQIFHNSLGDEDGDLAAQVTKKKGLLLNPGEIS